jgi:hypothetical protein
LSWSFASRRSGSAGVPLALIFAVCPILVFLTVRAPGLAPVVPEEQVVHRPIQRADSGYVSSDACKACHPNEYDSWHRSYHRTMTQVATPETVVADFSGTIVSEVPGQPMQLARRGRELWATFDDPDAASAVKPRIERQVVMTTGSHHQQIFWYATGRDRLLGQLQAEYLIEDRRWVPRSSVLMHPPGRPFSETGSWSSTCQACHATLPKPRLAAPVGSRPDNRQRVGTEAVEFGIACEACHGPGQEHAGLNRSPWRRYRLHVRGDRDLSITQPTHLDPQRSSQVCGQCHSVWEFYDAQGERHANSAGLPYRPGDELSATRLLVQPAKRADSPALAQLMDADPQFIADSFWSDGMIRVSGREYNGLVESPCYRDAPDAAHKMSCFSCHQMHEGDGDPRPVREWARNQLAPGMYGNGACLQCHASFAANITAHTRHSPSSSGSSCYNCHMPYTTYGLMRTLRSHQISSPSVAVSVETGRPNACNLCHLDQTLAWTAAQLEKQYGIPAPELSSDQREIAASLLWLLNGDAGQRAIAAQGMAWPPAQRVSGTEWMAPYLAQLLDDPYEAVRFIVERSLRTTPGFSGFAYAFTAPPAVRQDASARAIALWEGQRRAGERTRVELLQDEDGRARADVVKRLIDSRNNRRMYLRE